MRAVALVSKFLVIQIVVLIKVHKQNASKGIGPLTGITDGNEFDNAAQQRRHSGKLSNTKALVTKYN